MSFLDLIFVGEPKALVPWDDAWYEPFGTLSAAGIPIDEGAALRVSAVFNAVRMISESVASFPFILYRRLPDRGGKERAQDEPLFEVLHDRPNDWQTSFEFREFMQGCALLRGNAYAEILSGRRGFVDQLIPLHPSIVDVERLPNRRLRYQVREPNGTKRAVTQDRMFHLRGFGSDGVKGISVLSLMRESVGLALATESHGARVFSQRANHAGVLEVPGTLDNDGYKRLKKQQAARATGLANAHSTMILEQGMTWKSVGMNLEDAQFLLTRTFQIQEIARWFNIQPHKLSDLTKSSFNNIEEENLDYVTDTVGPWNVRWEQTVARDLIMNPREFFVELLVDALLRGRTENRYKAHGMSIRDGWRTPNEIREIENSNKIEGLDYFVDVRQTNAGPDATGPTDSNPAGPPPQRSGRAIKIVADAARRMVRKEIAQLEKRAERYSKEPEKWSASVARFYKEHALTLSDVLHLEKPIADAYCDRQKSNAIECGLTALNSWNETKPNELVELALQ